MHITSTYWAEALVDCHQMRIIILYVAHVGRQEPWTFLSLVVGQPLPRTRGRSIRQFCKVATLRKHYLKVLSNEK
jgi:hypothetical protein